jgi:hypothetical protein
MMAEKKLPLARRTSPLALYIANCIDVYREKRNASIADVLWALEELRYAITEDQVTVRGIKRGPPLETPRK